MTGWDELDRFLQTDPRYVGCDQALRILLVYLELVLDDESGTEAARRYPGVEEVSGVFSREQARLAHRTRRPVRRDQPEEAGRVADRTAEAQPPPPCG